MKEKLRYHKQSLRQVLTNKPSLQEMLKVVLQAEIKILDSNLNTHGEIRNSSKDKYKIQSL